MSINEDDIRLELNSIMAEKNDASPLKRKKTFRNFFNEKDARNDDSPGFMNSIKQKSVVF